MSATAEYSTWRVRREHLASMNAYSRPVAERAIPAPERATVTLLKGSTMKSDTTLGHSSPLGATVSDGGVNFSLFSRTATGVDLLFFDREDDARPACAVSLDPVAN